MIDLSLFQQYGPALLRGLGMTIFCWLVGTVFAMALGFVLALVQRSVKAWPVQWLLRAYVEFIRCTPLLLLIYTLYRPSTEVLIAAFLGGAALLSLLLLPVFKGAFVGLQWAKRMHGFGQGGEDRPNEP